MAKNLTKTGLPKSDERRWHFDLYAVLEGPQELYFGHETQVNVNMVETVHIDLGEKDEEGRQKVVEKCYLSPTKRRGVERRTLIWAPLGDGRLLGDKLGCGIPHTCTQPTCPICSVYGGLIVSDTAVEEDVPGGPKRAPNTFIGRLVHAGGVAVQTIEPSEKQRAMHPSMMLKAPSTDPTPTPFKKQYNEPALLYPVYNHAMSVSDTEFSAAAYAFLGSLARIGASEPKGIKVYETMLNGQFQPMLVLDRYLAPLGKRPVISPAIMEIAPALDQFISAAHNIQGKVQEEDHFSVKKNAVEVFQRWIGSSALCQLQEYALNFTAIHLLAKE